MLPGPLAALFPFGLLLLALIGASFLAYPLHLALPELMPIRSLVSRGALLLIVLSLPWLIGRLGLGRKDLGIPKTLSRWLNGLASGLAAGAAIMALLVLMEATLGLRLATWQPGHFAEQLLKASAKPLLVGLLVGCVEELLFRGVLLGALLKHRGVFFSIAVSAFYYALPHFYHSGLKPADAELGWDSGLIIAWDGLANVFQWSHLDSFAALFCAGLLLGCLRLLTPFGLAFCIGIHTGWVYILRTTRSLSDPVAVSPWRFLTGNYDHIIGWLAAGWLLLLTLPLLWMLYKRNQA